MSIISDAGGDALLDEHGRPLMDEVLDVRPASADYADTILALLPSGRVWPREPSSILARIVGALAPTFARIDQRARYLLTDSPSSTSLVELLPEWEATLGLPDACTGPLPTIELRQGAVRAAIAARGGQSIPYYTGIAARLNQAVTIQEFTPSRFGRAFGRPFGGEDWAYTWRVIAPQTVISPFQFGAGRFGDPFRSFGSTTLQCTFGRIKPAHTVLQIAYSS